LLAVAVLAMVGLAGLQIVLRNGFDGGIVWIDPLLRALVLWTGVLGAIAASRGGRHITIDVATRLLPERLRRRVRGSACALTAVICAVLAWQSARYVALEYEFADTAFAGVPIWAVAVVIPLGFALIGLRYLLLAIEFWRGRDAIPEVRT